MSYFKKEVLSSPQHLKKGGREGGMEGGEEEGTKEGTK